MSATSNNYWYWSYERFAATVAIREAVGQPAARCSSSAGAHGACAGNLLSQTHSQSCRLQVKLQFHGIRMNVLVSCERMLPRNPEPTLIVRNGHRVFNRYVPRNKALFCKRASSSLLYACNCNFVRLPKKTRNLVRSADDRERTTGTAPNRISPQRARRRSLLRDFTAELVFFYNNCCCSLKFARPKVECKRHLANIALLLYSFMPFCCKTCANFKMRLNQF